MMHTPVLVAETLELLDPQPGQRAVDATLGTGGHAEALLERILPGGRLLGIDRDVDALDVARERLAPFGQAARLIHGDFRHLGTIVEETGVGAADCVLFDLGTSALQLEHTERGFSLTEDGPLDMRMDPTAGPTAADLIRQWSARDLEQVLRDYGEERYARRIARAVAERRRELRSTGDLARLIERTVPTRERRIHPATRTFQALRMAVNDEPGALAEALETLPQWLAPGGRAAFISFHSGEDRQVKRAFRAYQHEGVVERLTRKPLRPSEAEVERNRRARSAKLRVARRRDETAAGERPS
jgi:16S rRNA (cytosine1402-N4)-methyltransferase